MDATAQDVVAISGLRRITFATSVENIDILEDLARRMNKSVGEIIRDSIALEKYVSDVRANNGRVIIEQDGKRQELLSV